MVVEGFVRFIEFYALRGAYWALENVGIGIKRWWDCADLCAGMGGGKMSLYYGWFIDW